MPYDASLDECLFTKAIENEFGRINVSVYSYNSGVKKLQIARENRTGEGDFRFTKLGRMTKDEAVAILPALQEALKNME